jgi:hypothetical protein
MKSSLNKPGKVLEHEGRDVVAQDVGVPDDGRVVDNLTDSVNNEDLKKFENCNSCFCSTFSPNL